MDFITYPSLFTTADSHNVNLHANEYLLNVSYGQEKAQPRPRRRAGRGCAYFVRVASALVK